MPPERTPGSPAAAPRPAGRRRPRRPAGRGWGFGLPLLLAGAAFLAVIALLRDEPTVRPLDLSVAAVAADPAAYEGRQVVLRGSVGEIPDRVPAGSEGAFVMTGAGGGRLLVIPDRPAQADALEEGATAHVSGVIRAPDSAADERRPERPPVTRTDLLGATGADAVLEAVEVAPAA